jgi:hypothetical protein
MIPRRSIDPRRTSATLLVAVLALVQVCTGFTAALADTRNMPAVTATAGCCGGRPEPVCSTAQDTVGAVGNCAPYCLQRQDAAKSDPVVLPAPSPAMHAGPFSSGRVAFPPHLPRLSAAAPPANGVPLIYLLQRLLI